ncbi:hypothetical protein ILUMI_08561 [Ignelater luminosus]|uniref:Uncharacterized protein n=1 Tax=Ignelater luminosus TaxID=2038154 RepID=A0A8K0GGW9_IGNLU|nr:hypothetical protein ILUMI_08561 [Ignelater luminosus]
MFSKLASIMYSLELNVRSLIQDVDSNVVEHFNSTVAKFVGGKQIHFSLRGSYSARCSAAVASFNTKRPHYTLHKTLCKSSPKTRIHNLEIIRQRKIRKAAIKRLGTRKVLQATTLEITAQYDKRNNLLYGVFVRVLMNLITPALASFSNMGLTTLAIITEMVLNISFVIRSVIL